MFSLRQGMLFKFFVFLIELNWIIIVSICLCLDHFTEKREIDSMKAALHNLLAIFMVNLNHLLPSKDDWTNRDLILSSSHGRRYFAPKLLFCFQSPKPFLWYSFRTSYLKFGKYRSCCNQRTNEELVTRPWPTSAQMTWQASGTPSPKSGSRDFSWIILFEKWS
jgi:hypothetical protein